MSHFDEPTTLPHAAETVLTFLESIGKREETELYLKLFRQLPRESFAIIAVEASQLSHSQGVLAAQIRYLKDLGLIAPIVVGLWEPDQARDAANRLRVFLGEAGVDALHCGAWSVSVAALRNSIADGSVPILVFDEATEARSARFSRIRDLAIQLESRKLVFLRPRGGLGPHGVSRVAFGPGHVLPCHAGGISVVNLRSDLPLLRRGDVLSAEDEELLVAIANILENSGSLLASITSPMGLLRELFTVKGSGTLVKSGSEVIQSSGYAELDTRRLRALLETSFAGALVPEFFDRDPLAVFWEPDYRGVAIVENSTVAPLLSKFAVDPVAQGEGLGRDLWQAMVRRFVSLVWRARASNPIVPWYVTQCDGMVRGEKWVVFWRNVRPECVPALVADLHERPEDVRYAR